MSRFQNRRSVVLVVALLASGASLVSCGSDSSSNDTVPATADTAVDGASGTSEPAKTEEPKVTLPKVAPTKLVITDITDGAGVGAAGTSLLVLLASHFMHGVAVGLHEATHGLLRKYRRFNEFDGVLLGVFSFMSFSLYRAAHQSHHAYFATERDEELWPFVFTSKPRWVRVLAAVLEQMRGMRAAVLACVCVSVSAFASSGDLDSVEFGLALLLSGAAPV